MGRSVNQKLLQASIPPSPYQSCRLPSNPADGVTQVSRKKKKEENLTHSNVQPRVWGGLATGKKANKVTDSVGSVFM